MDPRPKTLGVRKGPRVHPENENSSKLRFETDSFTMSTDADDWEDEQEPVDEWEDEQEPAEPAGDAFHGGWLMMEEPTDQPMTRLIPARGTPRPTCTSRISE